MIAAERLDLISDRPRRAIIRHSYHVFHSAYRHETLHAKHLQITHPAAFT